MQLFDSKKKNYKEINKDIHDTIIHATNHYDRKGLNNKYNESKV